MVDNFYIDLDILNNETRKVFDYLDMEEFIINKEILVYIINNKELMLKLIDIMLDKSKYSIKLDIKDRESSITISKMSLFQELMKLTEEDNLRLDREISSKLSNVFRNTIYNVPSNSNYEVIIDNVKEVYPVSLFFEFLYLEKMDYKLIGNINIFRGYELSHFVYALIEYLKKNHILDLYDFNNEIIDKIKDLVSMQYVDYEAFNKFQDINNNLDKIKLNEELESILDKEMEEGRDTFDKIMKVYLKLGSLFDYDLKFFLGEYTNHKKIKNVSKLSLRNTKTVCFEMYAILTYYLKKLNINYKVYPENYEYGTKHPYIVFRYDEYLIKLDLVNSIFSSDLINIKLDDNLNGITCRNKNEKTKLSFNNFLSRYYKSKFFDYNDVMLPRTRFIYDNPISNDIKELLRYIEIAYSRVNVNLNVVNKLSIFITSLEQLQDKYNLSNMDIQVVYDYNNIHKIDVLLSLYDSSNDDYMYVLYDLNYLQIFNRKDMKEILKNANITRLQDRGIPGIDDKKKTI